MRIAITTRTKIRKHLFDDEWDFPESERSRYVFHGPFSSSSSDNDFDEIAGDIDNRDADVEDREYEKPREPFYRALYASEPELDEYQTIREVVVKRGGDGGMKDANESCIGPGRLFGSC